MRKTNIVTIMLLMHSSTLSATKLNDRQGLFLNRPLIQDFTNLVDSITVQKTKTVTTNKKVELQATYNQIFAFLDALSETTTCDDINTEKETIKTYDTSN